MAEERLSGKYLIINSDDFGWSAGITEGILRAHREGVVSSTTLAANMPHAAEAIARLAEAPELGVGVHLNMSQGPPLSEQGKKLANENGQMNRTAIACIQLCLVRPWMLRAVEAEFDAQIRWALDHRVTPTHLDSHRHAHAFGPIWRIAVKLARRYDIPFVRAYGEPAMPERDGWPEAPPKQRQISRVINTLAKWNRLYGRDHQATGGTWGIAHTGEISAAWLVKVAETCPSGVTEIMTHPGLPGDLDATKTRLLECRQRELDALCDPAVRDAFARYGVSVTHYGKMNS